MIGMSTDKGGVEAYIMNLCGNMDSSKYKIIHCWPTIEIDGKKWVCPPNRHNYLKYRAFWKRFYTENKFDVVYANVCDIVSIDHIKFAKSAGIPVRIIHSHNAGNQLELEKKLGLVHRIAEKRNKKTIDSYATNLLACSESAGEWMFGNKEFTIVKNGISLQEYSFDKVSGNNLRERYGIREKKVIGVVGRLDPQKNPLYTSEILRKLIEKNSDYVGVFIGDGALKEQLKEKIIQYDMQNKILLIGAVDNVNEWMSAIDCILMPSLFEGLPFVLVEAQAAGVPCVVSSTVSEEANITGMIEYVSLDEKPEIWAEKLKCACEKNRYDLSEKLIDSGYSIADTADKVSKIIEESLNKK